VGVSGYNVYLGSSLAGSTTTATSYGFTGLVCGSSYTLAVEAFDAAGNVSGRPSVVAQTAACPDPTSGTINTLYKIGSGFTEAFSRSIVRTPGQVVYGFIGDDRASQLGTGPGTITAWRGDQSPIPKSFSKMDVANQPTAPSVSDRLSGPDVRLDRNGVVHVLYQDYFTNTVYYTTFSTVTNTWGAREVIATSVEKFPHSYERAFSSMAIILDQNEVPHVAYGQGGQIMYRNRIGGSWSAPQVVATGQTNPIHLSMVADAAGNFYLAWLEEPASLTSNKIYFATRQAGVWQTPEIVARHDAPQTPGGVLTNNNLDQSPSIALLGNGDPVVLYLDRSEVMRVKERTSPGTWVTPAQGDSGYAAHGAAVYTQGSDLYAFQGHIAPSPIYPAYTVSRAGGPWSPDTQVYGGPLTLDGSASIRYDPQRETASQYIDVFFMDEDEDDASGPNHLANFYYIAVQP
jgi:hypothetical protein